MISSVDLPTPGRALAIGAHSDDVELNCGATVAKWTAAGAEVHLCVMTDGSKGTWDPSTDLTELVATRQAEQRAAAEVLGIESVHFLDFVDGELLDGLAERRALCGVIRTTRPDVVLGHDPWKRYRVHPDHRAAGHLTIDAIVAARDPHFFPDEGAPHRPTTLLLYEAEEEDHAETVEGFIDNKVEALLAHKSQWQSTFAIDPTAADTNEFATRIHEEAEAAGKTAGIPNAELFKRLEPL